MNANRGVFAAVVEASSDAIITKTLDGTITSWNAAAHRLLGYSAEEAIGNSITMLFPEELVHDDAKRMKLGLRFRTQQPLNLGAAYAV